MPLLRIVFYLQVPVWYVLFDSLGQFSERPDRPNEEGNGGMIDVSGHHLQYLYVYELLRCNIPVTVSRGDPIPFMLQGSSPAHWCPRRFAGSNAHGLHWVREVLKPISKVV